MNIAECVSYPALQSRLAENPFVRDGMIDLDGPAIRLDNLSREVSDELALYTL